MNTINQGKLLFKFERSPMMDNMINYHSARLMEFSATTARFLIRISTPHRDVWKIAFYQ